MEDGMGKLSDYYMRRKARTYKIVHIFRGHDMPIVSLVSNQVESYVSLT